MESTDNSLDTVEAILSGEEPEQYLWMVEDVETTPDYILQHEKQREKAEAYNKMNIDGYKVYESRY